MAGMAIRIIMAIKNIIEIIITEMVVTIKTIRRIIIIRKSLGEKKLNYHQMYKTQM